jgi:hypothetical protein
MPQHRVYIASPYTHSDPAVVEANVARSVAAAAALMRKGHLAHSPLAATHPIAALAPDVGYEDYMRLDLSLIEHWATALLFLAPSPGANRELQYARELGRTVFYTLDEVPPFKRQ